MQLFRYTEDRLPVAIFTAYFALDVILFFTVQSFWVLLLWLVLGIIPKACISAWNHHHQHVMTFKQPLLNRLLEIVYTFHTGITGNAWVLHHVVGHHLHYLDQEKDESRWKRLDGTKMGEQEYSFNVAMTAYPRAYQVGLKFKKHMKIFLWMCAISLTLLSLAFWYNWRNALMVFLLPMLISLYLTAKTTYKHHSGLDTDDEFAASTNILNHVYNICTGNLGYHTAHHVKMGIHWSRLPEYHATIAHKIPQHCYLEPGFPWNIFPAHAPAIQPAVAPQKQPVEG